MQKAQGAEMDTKRVEDGGNPVMAWFGVHFVDMHPQLQALHRYGGRLCGPVELAFGRGFAGVLGCRLAYRLGMPSTPGRYPLDVAIRYPPYDDGPVMAASFRCRRTDGLGLRAGWPLAAGLLDRANRPDRVVLHG